MRWTGKIIGGLIGFILFNIFGAIMGVFIGNLVDQGRPAMSPSRRREIEHQFFTTSFRLLGHIAKADGRISEEEIAGTEALMTRMGLSEAHRKEAIAEFKRGAAADFNLDVELEQFLQRCGRRPRLTQALLSYLVMVALADGQIAATEEHILRQVATRLGMPAAVFDRLLGMIRAQASFHQQGGTQQTASPNALHLAYGALGLTEDASNAEVKRAYRKLISENHPDKLIGQGMPEDMVKMATERSQEIRAAYDLIKRSRGI